MNLTRALIGTLALATSALAFAAGSYDAEIRKVDSAIAASKMNPSTTDQARKLRADNERMMKEGQEAEAMKLLEDVKKLLGVK